MERVCSEQLRSWVPAVIEHRRKHVDEVEIVAGGNKLKNKLIGFANFRNQPGARRTRLDRNVRDARCRQRLTNPFDKPDEFVGNIRRLSTFRQIIVAGIDDNQARRMWKNQAIEILCTIRQSRAAETPIDNGARHP